MRQPSAGTGQPLCCLPPRQQFLLLLTNAISSLHAVPCCASPGAQVIDGVNDLIQELKDIDDAIAAQVGMGPAHIPLHAAGHAAGPHNCRPAPLPSLHRDPACLPACLPASLPACLSAYVIPPYPACLPALPFLPGLPCRAWSTSTPTRSSWCLDTPALSCTSCAGQPRSATSR
jgi:hypothetical protein